MEILEEGETYFIGNYHKDEYSFDDLRTFKTKKYFKISQISLNWKNNILAGIQVDYQNVLTRGFISTDWHCTLLNDSKTSFKKDSFSLEPYEYIVRIQAITTQKGICLLGFLTSENRILSFGAVDGVLDATAEFVDHAAPKGYHFNYISGSLGLIEPIVRNLKFEVVEIPQVKMEFKEEIFDIAWDLNNLMIRG